MNRVPEPISGVTWRYVAIYVLSIALGAVAAVWGVWLSMPFVTATVSAMPAFIHDSKTTFGIVIGIFGGLQAWLCGPVARGLSLVPFSLALCWATWACALAAGNWHTPGPAIYGMLAVLQLGLVALVNYTWLEEAAAVIGQTVAELRRA